MLDQKKAPLLEALKNCAQSQHAAFYAPGHKRGVGISKSLADFLGIKVFAADLPELPELDNLFAPEGVIKEAQQLAAEAFGAEQTWFLINGSTAGIIAAILATCAPGEKIILPRNVHRAAISGLILSGAVPIFINPEYNSEWEIANTITPASLALALEQHPDAKAVMVLSPTYWGVCADIEALASITHKYNIPLIVDEAHGAHFGFHPDLPPSALSCGADLTIQSTHKVLGAMTQASMLHIQGKRIIRERINQSLQLVQTTSPSYLLLASLDAARQQIALQGEILMAQTLQLADEARARISEISGLSVWQPPKQKTPGFFAFDRTRLTVSVADLGLTGYEADTILRKELGVTAELPSHRHLTFIISFGNTPADIDRLVQGFTILSKNYRRLPLAPSPCFSFSLLSSLSLSPRQAFNAATETLPISECVGRVSAEIVCAYPPGIPILMPGEMILAEALNELQQVIAGGGMITGCNDPSLQTLRVVRN